MKRRRTRGDCLSRSPRIDDEVMLSTTPVRLHGGSFFRFCLVEKEEEEEDEEEAKEERERGRHGSAPSKIIPWSVSWHPMIVRRRLEWSVSLSECTCALHVLAVGRLSRSPAAYKTVTSYQEEAWEGRGDEGKREKGGYNYTLTLASSRALLPSPSFSLSIRLPMYNLCSSNGVLWR